MQCHISAISHSRLTARLGEDSTDPFLVSCLLLILSNLSHIKTSLTKNEQESSTCYANDSKSIPISVSGAVKGGRESQQSEQAGYIHPWSSVLVSSRLFICKQVWIPDRFQNVTQVNAAIRNGKVVLFRICSHYPSYRISSFFLLSFEK